MIALDREMPEHCLECPCLQTLFISEGSAEYWLRFCAGMGCTIYLTTAEDYNAKEEVRTEWIHFSKPKSCPWIDVGNVGLKWTMTFPDDCDDEERWHHNMAGFGGDY